MKISSKSVIVGKEGIAWYDYSIIWKVERNFGIPSPYQNPDRTLTSLIMFIAEHYGY